MKIDTLVFENDKWYTLENNNHNSNSVNIVFVFGDIDNVEKFDHSKLLKSFYPKADIVVCSTAGNILDTSVDAYRAVASAISFESASTKTYAKKLNFKQTTDDVNELINMLPKEGLKHILFFGPGLINGSEMLDGIQMAKNITISGGLAGDGYKFEHTFLRFNEMSGENLAIAIGFYGTSIHVEIGCETGWQEFGAKRVVTKSSKNIVYEIDNKPAIELYERYLGDKITQLPNSALRFPLSVQDSADDKNEVIRVIIKINEDKSLVFAGDIKEGSIVQLMKTNVHNILDGAFLSAKKVRPFNSKPSLAITISCSARRSVLKQFSEEEIEIVQDILTQNTQIIGFYSYGEIAPFSDELSKSLLHNQTMTITTIYEE